MATDNPFWDFSLRVYGHPGVPAACLRLQDETGADVNLLLFAVWAAKNGHVLTVREAHDLNALCQDWRSEVVQPLRAARRWMKTECDWPAESLRQQVKALELDAEHLQQDQLNAYLPLFRNHVFSEKDQHHLARQNLLRVHPPVTNDEVLLQDFLDRILCNF